MATTTELLFAPSDPGQNGRHVDAIWPLWNLFDYTLLYVQIPGEAV